MWEYEYNTELYHYGIKGMKWGVRKARKRAQAENVKGRSKKSTGKNYDEFIKQDKLNKEAFDKQYSKKYGNSTSYNPKAHREVLEFNAKRQTDLNEAILKDINPALVDEGIKYLHKKGYNLAYLGSHIPKNL